MMLRWDTDSICGGGKLVAHCLLQACLWDGRVVHTVAYESTKRVDSHDLEDKQETIRIGTVGSEEITRRTSENPARAAVRWSAVEMDAVGR
jgi:hypothetical protein